MIKGLAKKLFGSANDRLLSKFKRNVDAINAMESTIKALSDSELRAKTAEFKSRLQNGETLDDILVEAFAVTREAAWRVLGQRHFDVQLLGGMALHKGMICEMRTGEGKTLVSTLSSYLNALTGKGLHIVTVNDYLAQRDSEWMGQVHRFLGLSVGCIVHDLDDNERKQAYAADITYGTNHELGFDYLRDNMKFRLEDRVQRPFNYAVVDEVDSILIDEARTPLIISGPTEESEHVYVAIDQLIPSLTAEDYEKDEKQRSVMLTEQGAEKIEQLLEASGLLKGGSLYDTQNISLMHHINQALKAYTLFQRDVDYIVKDDKVIIIDEFTGRMMDGRRYSDGLHQALEAKEKVKIEEESQTLATVTYQNFFRLYPKLSGMTGTGLTEAGEFLEIYGLDVVAIPTNKPVARKDMDDVIYRTAREKYKAIITLIEECKKREQPVLVGTVSIEKSEVLGDLLTKHKIPHKILNARFHDQEAKIIADAGRPGAITIATNMAGRGTDIQLGGNFDVRLEQALQEKGLTETQENIEDIVRKELAEDAERVRQAGGLFVIGTERHESRRIDNQLRGRSGRQGDPGASKFFLSLEDDLMRIFGSHRLDNMLQKLGLEEDEAITHRFINRALERAQQKVEARNFDIRKHLLKYDDVMNAQRKVIYEQRIDIMSQDDLGDFFSDIRYEVIQDIVSRSIPEHAYPENWDVATLKDDCKSTLGLDLPIQDWANEEGIAEAEIIERLTKASDTMIKEKETLATPEAWRSVERNILIRLLDQTWKEHLLALDHLRDGINLRAYAQRDPLNEYKQEAFTLFQGMLRSLRQSVTAALSNVAMNHSTHSMVELPHNLDPRIHESSEEETRHLLQQLGLSDASGAVEDQAQDAESGRTPRARRAAVDPQNPATWTSTRRNDPCPCGSGDKYKKCHGSVVA